ncbi:unnamed protein product [Linum trigynum]|uniref:Uncharacterized protein n=1 Tax=Linum trigynum TaxID=586398 RepID=A0AAV2CL35_9ROSI
MWRTGRRLGPDHGGIPSHCPCRLLCGPLGIPPLHGRREKDGGVGQRRVKIFIREWTGRFEMGLLEEKQRDASETGEEKQRNELLS